MQSTTNTVVTNAFSLESAPDAPDTKPAEDFLKATQDGTAQFTPNLNPIPAAPASDAAQPIGGDSGTPLSSDASAPATPAPAENTSSQLVVAQPTTEVSSTSDTASAPATPAQDSSSSAPAPSDLGNRIKDVVLGSQSVQDLAKPTADNFGAFQAQLQQTGAIDPNSFAALQDAAGKLGEAVNTAALDDPGIQAGLQNLINSTIAVD